MCYGDKASVKHIESCDKKIMQDLLEAQRKTNTLLSETNRLLTEMKKG
jgi:hypothetical protein